MRQVILNPSRSREAYSTAEVFFVLLNYGKIPLEDICNGLGRDEAEILQIIKDYSLGKSPGGTTWKIRPIEKSFEGPETEELIFNILKNEPERWFLPHEIAEIAEVPESNVRKCLKELCRAGLAERKPQRKDGRQRTAFRTLAN